MTKRLFEEMSVSQIEGELDLRKRIYRALFEVMPPDASGARVCEVVDISTMFDSAIHSLVAFVERVGEERCRFEGNPWEMFEKMRRLGWINYSRARKRRGDGQKVYQVYLIANPDELNDSISPVPAGVDPSVTLPGLTRIDANALETAFSRLFDASTQYGEERFVACPENMLRRAFGPSHDADNTIALLVDAGLAEWRDGMHGAVTSERLFLYQPKS